MAELCGQIERAGELADLDLPMQFSRLRARYAQTLRALSERYHMGADG